MRFLSSLSLSVAILALTAAAPASASTIVVTNFAATSPTSDLDTGWALAGATATSSNTDLDHAESFALGADYALDSLTLALAYMWGTNSVDVWLAADSSGAPGSVIESFTVTNLGNFGSAVSPTTLNSGLHPTLLAGVTYWLVASATTSDALLSWNMNNIGDTGGSMRMNGGAWNPTGGVAAAFAVSATPSAQETTPVPEPATLSLLGLGLAGAGARRWRQRNQQ